MHSRGKILPNWLIAAILTGLMLAAMLTDFYPLKYLENKIYDGMSHLRQRETTSPIVLVEIDDRSIKEIGSWPWPRTFLAQSLKQFSSHDTKAIGIDLLMPGKEVNSGLNEIRKLRSKIKGESSIAGSFAFTRLDQILAEAENRLDYDTHLLDALMPAKNVVLPYFFSFGKPGDKVEENMPKWLRKFSLPPIKETLDPLEKLRRLRNPLSSNRDKLPIAVDITPTLAKLAAGAGAHGHVNHLPDNDGILRSEPLFIRYEERLYPSFALELALSYMQKGLDDIRLTDKNGRLNYIQVDGRKIPVDDNFRMLIDFQQDKKEITSYSFADILHNKVPAGALRDKIILIGVTATDLVPTFMTPISKGTTGTEVTANALENIISNTYVSRPPWILVVEIMLLFYFGFFLLYFTTKVSSRSGAIILLFFLITLYIINTFLFVKMGFWFKLMPATLVSLLGFGGILLNRALEAPYKKQEDNTEMNKMLGLSFQSQGMLDMAFDNFMKCSIADPSVKEALYNLGLDFERKRMFNKAVSVYEYLLKDGRFKDITDRIRRLRRADKNALGGGPINRRSEGNLVLDNPGARPTLGRYEIIQEIGQGAIGTVYLGRDPKINRKVAIKTLRYDDIDKDQLADVKERFFREAEAAGRLSHPNIITIYDAGEDYDITYMAMEFIDGHNLSRYCRKDNLFPPKMALNVVIRVAFALDYAHKNQVVHRDIKPANIMITNKGNIKVTDFGIARLTTSTNTQTGVILGTPNYMSPEQVLGKKVDGRSDLFSLGAVLYELLTGEKPFRSDNIGTLMHNISNVSFTPLINVAPELPSCLVNIVNKLLAKNPAQRFQTAGAVVIEASKCLEEI